MFLIKSEDKPTIVPHFCNTEKLANIIKNYIEPRHNCTCIISEPNKDKVYYDPGGAVYISSLLVNVEIGEIMVNIDHVDILVYYLNNKIPCFDKGFIRLSTFFGHLSLSEEEFLSTKKYVNDNLELINSYTDTANQIINDIINKMGKNKKENN